MDDDRVIDLEVKLAYQERLIHDLDALVREFAARLAKVEGDLDQLKRGTAQPVVSERPPHY
jgi:uncharacterized coiled-coil protein SlyX